MSMRLVALGLSDLKCTRLAYGCWRLAGTWNPAEVTPEAEARGRAAVIAAYETGYTLFDTADIYCKGVSERILGQAIKEVLGMRERVLIATKCGIRFPGEPNPNSPQRYDFSAEHIIRSCEDSLKRMRLDTIDLYQLHRPDLLADPQEVARAFSELKRAGKAQLFGVSNFRPSLVTALQAACPMTLAVHQVEISLARLDCFTDGTLDQCLVEKLTPMAWSPLGGGWLAGGTRAASSPALTESQRGLAAALEAMAKDKGTTPMVVALAWLLKHPGRIVPIVGTINPKRIKEAAAADSLELSREEWYRLLLAARGTPLP